MMMDGNGLGWGMSVRWSSDGMIVSGVRGARQIVHLIQAAQPRPGTKVLPKEEAQARESQRAASDRASETAENGGALTKWR